MKIIKYAFSIIICCTSIFCFCIFISAETYGGSCGDGVSWTFNSDTGTLKINGIGAIKGEGYIYPWDDNKDSIVTINIDEGITLIDSYAFAMCINLQSVTIPSTVTNICQRAFGGCEKLTEVNISPDVVGLVIGVHAFDSCSSLQTFIVPKNTIALGEGVFYKCTNLKSVTFLSQNCDVWNEYGKTMPRKTVIYGYEGSTAEAYAKKYSHKFGAINLWGEIIESPNGCSSILTKDIYVFFLLFAMIICKRKKQEHNYAV